MRLVGMILDGASWIGVERPEGVAPVAPSDRFYTQLEEWLERAARLTDADVVEGAYPRAAPVPLTAKVLCAGLNYRAHAEEAAMATPPHPDVFGRWASTLVPSMTPVPVPDGEPGLDWEGELVAVIGRPLRGASPVEVEAAVLGYACFNDLSARRHQKATGQWTIGKNADLSGPIGPAIVTRDELGDPYGLRLQTRVDGEVVQDATTDEMIFTIGQIGAYASECMTLQPGDVIATGTPQGVGLARTPPVYLQPGQVVEVEIERIGALVTPIVETRGALVGAGARPTDSRQR